MCISNNPKPVPLCCTGLIWLSCLLLASPSAGAEARQSLKLVAHILPRASLRLSQDQITFAGYEDQAVIPSQEGPQVTVRGRTSPGSSLVLSLGAASGLEGPKASIPDSQVTCSFQGKGAVGRVALDRQQQPLARWRTGGVHTGELTVNSIACSTIQKAFSRETYAGTAVLTLMSP